MSSIEDMMKKAVTTGDAFYKDRNAVEGYKDRKDNIRKERREQKNTLSQWYGMQRAALSKDDQQELELLKYRNFINPDLQHQAPKKTGGITTDFVEFGYVAGTGRNKRRRLKSFADEWIEESPRFQEIVSRRIKRNVKCTKRAKIIAAKKIATDAARAKAKKTSKRQSKADKMF